ncbi:hypothetical protein J1N35_024590 [Gossypium stocksii]|uniref:DUF4220 domain-containing protein n=1 Tax=Gossypium stocksii TaxID=47602 RepID=A0A9D3V513_9ROSI|nr:hypothetical protein J1N35_024590 [Gossypium stocksii]
MPPYIPLHITEEVKSTSGRWNIRGAILFSLWLQVLLVLVAPLRKSARGKFNVILIWFAYLLADAVANFAVGLISNSQRNQYYNAGYKANQKPEENSNLLAFWAPFLLLHLGGPDNITAFALEDNELWLRHFLGLGFQAGAIVYVFIQSLPNKNLWVPTLLMFVAGIINFHERDESRDFFKIRDTEDALRVIEFELNFLYGTFYTKVEVLHLMRNKIYVGYILRFLAFACVLATLGIFYFKVNKHEFHGVDIGITYILLLGAIALDVMAIFMLIFSYRSIASIKDPKRLPCWWQIMFESILRFLKLYECFNKCATCICHVIEECLTPIRKGLGKIFWPYFEKIFSFCAKDFMDEMVYVSLEPFSLDLWKFIFEELKTKSEFADTPETAMRISLARGDWALTYACEAPESGELRRYLIRVPYDESILLWHIATNLCYHPDDEKDRKNTKRQNDNKENPTDRQDNEEEELTYRQFSKTLSDYMLYLLVFRPTMIPAVESIGKLRFRDTCAEAEMFFKRKEG